MHRKDHVAAGIIFCLFVASFLSQGILPLIHLRDVDLREADQRSCKNHPTNHVERDPGPSHHDSTTCPVCQIIHSSQPTEVQETVSLLILAQQAPFSPFERESLDPRGPPLTGSSPRAPPLSV
jgi:hypothetical protein